MANLGDNSRVKFDGKTIAGATAETFGLKTDFANISTKDNVGWDAVFPVKKSGELSADLVFDKKPGSPTQAYLKDFVDAWLAGTLTTWEFAVSQVSGDIKFTGNCYVGDINIKGDTGTVVTATVSLRPSGTITVGTV